MASARVHIIDSPVDYERQLKMGNGGHRIRSHYLSDSSLSRGGHPSSFDTTNATTSTSNPDRSYRMIQMLEEDLEATKRSLKHARESLAREQELSVQIQDENNYMRDIIRQMEEDDHVKTSDLTRQLEMKMAEVEQLRGNHDNMLRQVDAANDRAVQQLQAALDATNAKLQEQEHLIAQLHDDNSHLSQQLTSNHGAYSDQVTDLELKVESLNQELKSKARMITQLQDQLERELARRQESSEASEKLITTLQREKDAFEKKFLTATQSVTNLEKLNAQLTNTAELKEQELQQLRRSLEELHVQQNLGNTQVIDLQRSNDFLIKENESKTRRVAELEEMFHNSECKKEEFQAREERLRKLYEDVGTLIGASDAQKSALQVDRAAQDLIVSHKQFSVECKKEIEAVRAELNKMSQKCTEAESTVVSQKSGLETAEQEINSLRGQLLHRTRELRRLTLALVDKENKDDQIRGLEDSLIQKQKELQDHLNICQQSSTAAQTEYIQTLRDLRTRLTDVEDREKIYADSFRQLGRLLRVPYEPEVAKQTQIIMMCLNDILGYSERPPQLRHSMNLK